MHSSNCIGRSATSGLAYGVQIKQTVMQWAVAKDVGGQPLPPFIKNKLAHVLVTIAQVCSRLHHQHYCPSSLPAQDGLRRCGYEPQFVLLPIQVCTAVLQCISR